MKYSVRYNRSLDLKSFDEIIIELKDEKYEDLLGFFNRYSDKRIVIKIAFYSREFRVRRGRENDGDQVRVSFYSYIFC